MDATAKLHQVRMVGRYGWNGGYTHALVMDDGETIGPECVRPNYRAISWATRHGERTGWCVEAVVALDGDEAEFCAHCGKRLA